LAGAFIDGGGLSGDLQQVTVMVHPCLIQEEVRSYLFDRGGVISMGWQQPNGYAASNKYALGGLPGAVEDLRSNRIKTYNQIY